MGGDWALLSGHSEAPVQHSEWLVLPASDGGQWDSRLNFSILPGQGFGPQDPDASAAEARIQSDGGQGWKRSERPMHFELGLEGEKEMTQEKWCSCQRTRTGVCRASTHPLSRSPCSGDDLHDPSSLLKGELPGAGRQGAFL
eukprot:762961-Hanusia_phi.AAC.9